MEGKVKLQGDLTKLMAAQVAGAGPGGARPRRGARRDHGVGAGVERRPRRQPRPRASPASEPGRLDGRGRDDRHAGPGRPAQTVRSRSGAARTGLCRRAVSVVATFGFDSRSRRARRSPVHRRKTFDDVAVSRVTNGRARGSEDQRDLGALVHHLFAAADLAADRRGPGGSSRCRPRSPRACELLLRGFERRGRRGRAPSPARGPCSRDRHRRPAALATFRSRDRCRSPCPCRRCR